MDFLPLKDFCDVVKGSTGISKAIPGKFPLVVTSEERRTHNEFQFDAKAVIIPLVSSTGHGHASLKRIHYQEGKFAVGSILCAVIPKNPELLNAEFLFHYLFLNKEKELVSRMKGMANVTLPIKEIEKIPIPILSIDDQRKFVKFYSSVKINSEEISTEFKRQLYFISQLRQAFLREAMQGTLVSNETKDGATGAQLLAEIQKEKEQLVKEKKIKKQKPLPPISNDEIPFEIPENWVWCRLGEIIQYCDNLDIQKKLDSNELVNYVDIESIDNKKFEIRGVKQKKVSELSSRARRVLKKDYIIYSTVRPYLKNIAIVDIEMQNFIGSTGFVVFKPIKVLGKYVFNFLLNPDLNKKFEELMVGFNSPSITNETFENTLIPLPPLEIQERIVAQLNELMQYCDALEEQVKDSRALNEQLLQQVLREALEGRSKKDEEVLPMVAEDTPLYSLIKEYNMSDMAILAGHIINTLSTSNDKDFGRVKLQKMLHLVQFHCNLDAPLQYKKKVAGPYCRDLESQLEQKLKQLRFFDIKKEKIKDYEQVVYTKLASSNELDRLFANEFEHKADEINNFLQKFRSKNTNFCEAVSTMYAVWNNRLLNKEAITDELLKTDFLKWDESKKKFIGKLDDILDWMRKNGVVPVGNGKII